MPRTVTLLLATLCCLAVSCSSAHAAIEFATPDPVASDDSLPAADGVPFDDFGPIGYQPRWSARMGAIFLQRARPAATPFVVDFNTGAPIVSPSNFIFPFQGGADVGLIRYGRYADVDFRYFGINNATASQGPFNVGPGASLGIPGSGGGGSPDPLTITSTYVTSLNSVETNLRENVSSRLTLLAGFRYISFRDRMTGVGVDTTNPSATTVGAVANNNLFGAQIGADAMLWTYGERFRIEGVLKAGVFGDVATASFSEVAVPGGGGSINTGHDHTAFVGDLNFTGVYQFNDRWALRAGYQLLWLSGVGTASEQLHNINLSNGTFTPNTSHGAFFHGATVGVERTW